LRANRDLRAANRTAAKRRIRARNAGIDGLYAKRNKSPIKGTDSALQNTPLLELLAKQKAQERLSESCGPTWTFSLFPLSKKEEIRVIKSSHWFKLDQAPFGDYKVAPKRSSIQIFQRKYWMYRELKSSLTFCSLNPSKLLLEPLQRIRNLIFLLGNGSRKKTKEQCSLFSNVYYCQRQCERLMDDRKALSERCRRRNSDRIIKIEDPNILTTAFLRKAEANIP